jgi:hypothetical protein
MSHSPGNNWAKSAQVRHVVFRVAHHSLQQDGGSRLDFHYEAEVNQIVDFGYPRFGPKKLPQSDRCSFAQQAFVTLIMLDLPAKSHQLKPSH